MDNYSGSSTNINANNVFDINRLGISNDFEAGRSLTLVWIINLIKLEDNQTEDEKINI